MNPRTILKTVLAGALVLAGTSAHSAQAAASCAGAARGGDWPSYGHDPSNSRSQPAEDRIGVEQASTLAPAWSSAVDGTIQTTPTVAGGCVYVTTSGLAGSGGGAVYALNADTGALVWKASAPPITGAAVVDRGRVYVLGAGVFLAAYDARTGRLLWKTEDFGGGATNASPAVYDVKTTPTSRTTRKVVFGAYYGSRSGWGVADATTGRMLKVVDTGVPNGGGAVWSSPARDREGYVYVGAGNPKSSPEHPYTDALLKIDMTSVSSRTFGKVVASYKGTAEQYLDEAKPLGDTAACRATAGTPAQITPVGSPVCAQFDFDFGASPNLFTVRGKTYVGALQKSGIYHAADTTTMRGAWESFMGVPCFTCNGGSTAVGPDGVYGVGTPGLLSGLDRRTGARQWVTPNGSPVHYYSTSVANGVVYTLDYNGNFAAYDAKDGASLAVRPLAADAGSSGPLGNTSSAGISIARHTVFVGASNPAGPSYVIAYRPTG